MTASADGKWLRIDEVENALDNVQMCCHFLEEIDGPIRWKWAMIALHQALYGFAICAVQGSNFTSVLKEPTKPATSQVISVRTALERAKSEEHISFGGEPLVTIPEEDEAIRRLVAEFRNEFEHFGSKSWSIELSGMPMIFTHVVRVVRFLALESGAVRYLSDEDDALAESTFERLKAVLDSEREAAA